MTSPQIPELAQGSQEEVDTTPKYDGAQGTTDSGHRDDHYNQSDEFDIGDIQQPTRDDDFSEFMWMEHEEEFDAEVMRQLEEQELTDECLQEMQRDARDEGVFWKPENYGNQDTVIWKYEVDKIQSLNQNLEVASGEKEGNLQSGTAVGQMPKASQAVKPITSAPIRSVTHSASTSAQIPSMRMGANAYLQAYASSRRAENANSRTDTGASGVVGSMADQFNEIKISPPKK